MPTTPYPEPDFEELRALADKLYKNADQEARDWLRPIRKGWVDSKTAITHFRRAVKTTLASDSDRISKPLRAELERWAITYGVQTRGSAPGVRRLELRLTVEDYELLVRAAGQRGVKLGTLVRQQAVLGAETILGRTHGQEHEDLG